MAPERLEELLVRLERRLGLEELDNETTALLEDELCEAEGELLLYLNMEKLPDSLTAYAVKLATVYYQRDKQQQDSGGEKAWSYSEGEQSQNITLLTPEDFKGAAQGILSSLAPYRQVTMRGKRYETP
jgi:hypothetical protein